MSIKRYGLCSIGSGITTMMSDSDGKFVKHEDYAALEQQLAASIAAEREWETSMMQACGEDGPKSVADKFAELQAKCAALAAENAALKIEVPLGAIENGRAFADRLEAYPFECQGGDLNMCSDWQELRRCFEHLSEWAMHCQQETPATDAFMAEVRASAVDSLIGIKTNQLARMHPDTHAFGATADFIRSQINELQSFAALLRKGVQS